MKKRISALLAAVCLLCTGCASLLNRSYSVVEPYTDRFWDSTAEDTLKAENYQDLVNSLLMLIAQRSEEGVIRYYASGGEDSYAHALKAKREVQEETILGSYLLKSISVIYSTGDGYCTLTYYMTYRSDVQDVSNLMALSDTQSLVDLLRVSVREEHSSLTAQFISKTSRSEVVEAINSLWNELYLLEMEASGLIPPPSDPPAIPDIEPAPEGDPSAEGGSPESSPGEEAPGEETLAGESPDGDTVVQEEDTEGVPSPDEEAPADGELPDENAEPSLPPEIQIPPCPWHVRFYPNTDAAEIVEIILK